MTPTPLRICPEEVRAANQQLDRRLATMSKDVTLRRWKIIKITLATTLVGALSTFGILQGADATIATLLAIVTIALLNGIEVAELISAYAQVQTGSPNDGNETATDATDTESDA